MVTQLATSSHTSRPASSPPGPAAETLTDEQLLEVFLDGTISTRQFGHREHVRVAWLLLRRHSLLEVLELFPTRLREVARRHGVPGLYHETITWAYLLLVAERAAALPHGHDWAAFAGANPDLLARGSALLRRYYRAETLDSPTARSRFVLPDRLLEEPPEPQPISNRRSPPSTA